MAKYTVKQGDTKGKLKQLFGVDINSSSYRDRDPNKLFAGEVIDIPDAKNPVSSVMTKGQIDLSKVVEDKKPVGPSSSITDLSKAFAGDGTMDEKMQKFADTNPEVADKLMNDLGYSKKSTDTPFPTYDPAPKTPEEQMNDRQTSLTSEIATLEEKIANKEANRTSALDTAGVFEDMQRLDELKAQLKAAEDRSIEIPIEKRQELRGQGATKTEFNAATRPELEKSLLTELAKSRETSRLTDVINTSIKIIDQKLDSEFEKDKFTYESKVKQLEKIEKLHADIITERQKVLLEDRKFQQSLILEGIKSDNSLRGDLLKEIAKSGIVGSELEDLTGKSVNELLAYIGGRTSPSNWDTLGYEEAARTLDKDTFAKYEKYIDFKSRGGITEEEDKRIQEGLGLQMGADFVTKTIEDMLADTEGLGNSVGTGGLGNKDLSIFGLGVESSKFRGLFKTLTSANTLETLKSLKAQGTSLGAVSEKELEILTQAQNSLGMVLDENGNFTGRSNLKESDFKTALETMRLASMKVYVAAGMGKAAYAASGLQNADYATVEKLYKDLKTNGSPALQKGTQAGQAGRDYAAEELTGAAAEVIKQEEGFRSQAYQDQTGKWTIGFGTTTVNGRPVQPGDTLSREQAEAVMHEQIVNNYTNFADTVTKEITPSQFAALTSFEYNLGPGVWNSTTGKQILSLINEGKYASAGELMKKYNKSRDPKTGTLAFNPVLAKRRAREADLLLA